MFFSVSGGKDVGICDKIETVEVLGILWMEWDLTDAASATAQKRVLLCKNSNECLFRSSFVCLVEFVCPFRLRSKTALSVKKNENGRQEVSDHRVRVTVR